MYNFSLFSSKWLVVLFGVAYPPEMPTVTATNSQPSNPSLLSSTSSSAPLTHPEPTADVITLYSHFFISLGFLGKSLPTGGDSAGPISQLSLQELCRIPWSSCLPLSGLTGRL